MNLKDMSLHKMRLRPIMHLRTYLNLFIEVGKNNLSSKIYLSRLLKLADRPTYTKDFIDLEPKIRTTGKI